MRWDDVRDDHVLLHAGKTKTGKARQLPADQAAARKLASDGTLRPHGIDSHGNYVFALSAKGQKQ